VDASWLDECADAIALASASATAAVAQVGAGGYPLPISYFSNQSVQYGLNLPQVPTPNGADEIRAADGTTCRSHIAGNGPTLDVGMLGNQDVSGAYSSGTVYGRVVISLGDRPKRIDCSSLYQLGIERLQHELRLVQMGVGSKGAALSEGSGADWQTKDWGNKAATLSAKGRDALIGKAEGPNGECGRSGARSGKADASGRLRDATGDRASLRRYESGAAVRSDSHPGGRCARTCVPRRRHAVLFVAPARRTPAAQGASHSSLDAGGLVHQPMSPRSTTCR
jgi:hypothetical protein